MARARQPKYAVDNRMMHGFTLAMVGLGSYLTTVPLLSLMQEYENDICGGVQFVALETQLSQFGQRR